MELIHCKAQCSCEEECIPKCMLYIVFLKKWNSLNLRNGRVVAHYTNIVYIISLVVICFKQIFQCHGGYNILNV